MIPQLRRVKDGPMDQLVRELLHPLNDLTTLSAGSTTSRLRLMPTTRCRELAFSPNMGGDALPAVFRSHPPWHPMDLCLADRGYIPQRQLTFDTYTRKVSDVTYWPLASVRVMYHLLTALHTNAHPWEYDARVYRYFLYSELLPAVKYPYPHLLADRAVKMAEGDPPECGGRPRFWGEVVPVTGKDVIL